MSPWRIFLCCSLLLCSFLPQLAVSAQDATNPGSQKEKFSYALGMQIGRGLRDQSAEIDPATFAKAFAAAISGGKTELTEEEMRTVLAAAQEGYQKKQAALREERAKAELEAGEKFLQENRKKPGVQVLPSGLQYKILQRGSGEKPDINETVICNYRGMLLNGIEFDGSERHGGPATFPLRSTIKGWREALLMMPAGSKWQLFVPSRLAYGQAGSGKTVPPNATLIFELELISAKEGDDQRERE